MYIPASFAVTDQHALHDFMEQHSFATLISYGISNKPAEGGSEPFASHLPFLLDRTRGPNGHLEGHMARANPQWQQADGQRVLVVFHGPHAYISPTWYESDNVVPTWNYVAVHAYGTLRVEQDRSRLLQLVGRTVTEFEAAMPDPWRMESQEAAYLDRMLEAIVGFAIEIDRIEGKWKLNQNHAPKRREKVIHALNERGGPDEQQIARLMAALES